jgi:hypothetical protein
MYYRRPRRPLLLPEPPAPFPPGLAVFHEHFLAKDINDCGEWVGGQIDPATVMRTPPLSFPPPNWNEEREERERLERERQQQAPEPEPDKQLARAPRVIFPKPPWSEGE